MNKIEELYYTDLDKLTSAAAEVCGRYFGSSVYLRGLIEFSNHCSMDCHYCGIRKSNYRAARYRMDEEEILSVIRCWHEQGLRTFVLQSGEDPLISVTRLCRLAEKIKNITGEKSALTLSCGIFTKKQFKELKNAGCDRYLMRFETSDERLYSRIRNGLKLKDRVNALYDLREAGIETGSGFMTGLPGETDETRIGNIKLCKKLELNMIGLGPFIPHPHTPLAYVSQESIDHAIRCLAIIRILMPGANIPATTATGSLDPSGREKMLSAGANVLMPNITPDKYKKDYLLYPGKICLNEPGSECIDSITMRMASTGKKLDWSRGDSLSWSQLNEQ